MKYLVTDLYQDFNCIGGECSDTCCAGWGILVDEPTYRKYQQLDKDTREWLCGNIIRNKNGSYEIVKGEDGRCPFLNEKNLCDIILRKSDEFISMTCQTYPRKTQRYNDTMFCTVSVSCPEVAKAIINHHTPLEFIFFEDKVEEREAKDWELHNALINGLVASVEILQDENLLLGKKYLLLLLLTEELETCIQRRQFDDIKNIINKYSEPHRNALIEGLRHIYMLEFDRWSVVSTFLEVFMQIKHQSGKLIFDMAEEALKTLNSTTYMNWRDDYSKLNLGREKENLSVQFIFEYFMDALNDVSLFKNLIKVYVLILYIEFFELCLLREKGELLPEDRVKIISELSRVMEHSQVLGQISDGIMKKDRTMNLIRILLCLN